MGFSLFVHSPLFAQQSNEQMASYYFSHGDFAQAAELYEPLYNNSDNIFYYQMLLRSYSELKEFRKAENLVNKRIRRFPRELDRYVDLGQLYLLMDDAKKAEKYFLQAIDKVGVDAKQTADLARAFANVSRLDLAVQTYLSSRSRSKNQFLYVNEVAALYEQQRDYQAMMAEYFALLDHSPASMSSIQVLLQRALSQSDNPQLVDGLRRTLVDRIQDQPNNKQNLEMMIWFSLQQKDFQFALDQAIAVDARFPDLNGEPLFRIANIALSNDALDVAALAFDALVRKGPASDFYFDSRVGALKVRFARCNAHEHIDPADLSRLLDDYSSALAELGRSERTVPLLRQQASLLAYFANDVQTAADILYDVLEFKRLNKNVRDEVKLELGDILLFAGEVWEASLLYMQVEKSNKDDVVGAMAKFRNAKLSYYNHDFLWAKSQLEVLRASTSKLIANDAMELSLLISDNMEADSSFDMLQLFADADLLLFRNQLDSAYDAFEQVAARQLSHPLLDEVLMRKALIRSKQGRYADADSLLARLVDFFPYDILADDALFRRAEINEQHLNNPLVALDCYQRILLDYSASLYTDAARKRYNDLKRLSNASSPSAP